MKDRQVSERGGFLLGGFMEAPEALDNNQLLELFRNRGMNIDGVEADKLKHINYYKLKTFAYPLAQIVTVNGVVDINYQGTSLKEVLRRYYQDKNLRLRILHAIEKIEISIKTVLARELGARYGAFGYLNFWLWANRSRNTCFNVEEKQYRIKKSIQKSLSKGTSMDYINAKNLDRDKFPTIWLAIDLLTFGDILVMLEMLNSSLLRRIATEYKSEPQEFLSWIKCVHFIRNICAHNANLIDVKLKTKPKCRNEWGDSLYSIHREQQIPTDRLAIVICIVMYLVKVINPKYQLKYIQKEIQSLCGNSEMRANLLGFKNLESARNISKTIEKIVCSKI